MKLFISLILLSLLLAGCGSSSHIEDKYKYPHNTSSTKEKKPVKKEKTPDPIVTDEFRDSPVLESQTGVASYYSDKFDGKQTSSGEIFRKNNLTAAHLKYPYNTILRVRNLLNNKSVIVRVNDRKPDFNGRIIDVSYGAAKILDMLKNGITEVRIEVLKWGNN